MDVCTKCLKEGGGYCNGCSANPEFDVAFEKLTNSYNNSFNKQRSKKDEYIKIKDLQNLLQNLENKLVDDDNIIIDNVEDMRRFQSEVKMLIKIKYGIDNLKKFYF